MAYTLKDGSRALVREFMEKYGVDIDVTKLLVGLGRISDITTSMKNNVEGAKKAEDAPEVRAQKMEEVKKTEVGKLAKIYRAMYTSLLKEAVDGFLENTEFAAFDEKKNCGALAEDFEKLMTEIMYQENTTAQYIPLDKLAYGGLDKDELNTFISEQDFPLQRSDLRDSFEGKKVSAIARDVRAGYIDGAEHGYKDYVSMIQALKDKNEERGFFGRLFHPIDSARERNLIRDLKERVGNRFPDRDLENDLATKAFLSAKGDSEQASMMRSTANLKKIEFDPETYRRTKMAELHEKYANPENTPEKRRAAAEEKYKKKIYPKIKEVYLANKEANLKAKMANPGAQEMPMDLSDVATSLGIEPVDMMGYERRFLTEMEEQERLIRESERFRNDVLPKFKEAFEKNNGDLSSLRDDIGEDFDLMKSVFLQNVAAENRETEAFQSLLESETTETLNIDRTIEASKISEMIQSKDKDVPARNEAGQSL